MNKVSFSWKPTISGRENWRWGLFMVVASRSGRSKRLRIMVRGLLLWLLSLAMGAYLALTSAWFVVLSQRSTNYVTWMDCVLAPARWDEIKRKRGDAYIAEGLIALENRKWSDAMLKLKTGLAHSPNNWRGRRSLGLFYLAAGQRPRGLTLLVEGFTLQYQGRDAMQLALQATLAARNYDLALAALDVSLEHSGGAVDRDREWLVDQKCRVLMQAKQYEDALAWIDGASRNSEIRFESKAVALIELGRFDEARDVLAEWGKGSGVMGGVQRISVRLEREAGDLTAMRESLRQMADRAPLDPSPRVYAAVQEYLAGEETAAQEALSGYLMRFDSRPQDYELAAMPLVEIKAWELFDQLMAHAFDRGIESETLDQTRLAAHIDRGEFDAAHTLVTQFHEQSDDNDPRSTQWLDVMEPWVKHLRNGDNVSHEQLVEALGTSSSIALALLEEVAQRLDDVGRAEAALSVWEIAHRNYPGYFYAEQNTRRLRQIVGAQMEPEMEIPLIADGVELDMESILPQIEEMDSEISRAMQSARVFEQLATRYLDGQNWTELENLLRELRRAAPVWTSAQRELITLAEIELNIVARNWPALVSTVRFQLDGSTDRALAVMRLARRLDDLDERRAAELLVNEVERRHANFPPVRRIRAEWAPVDVGTETEAAAPETPLPVR
ncbi:MAG: hypothetical protein HOH58_06565 [Opitutaceae bacterium]|nr:hypothetical protein [Opitutaceae bacterium]